MSLETLIGSLSREEKLAAMELLWEELSADSGVFVSPGWHERVIADRLARPVQGESLGIAAARAEVKGALDARRASR